MESHQYGVVNAVAITQEIPTDFPFEQFTIERQKRGYFLLSGLVAIGGISDGIALASREFGVYRVFVVGGQQDRACLVNKGLVGHGEAFLDRGLGAML
jgi:hypothetical protein